jgi:hypothetical protein
MHPDRDFEVEWSLPSQAEAVIQDLGLETLLHGMAGGDKLLLQVARRALLASLTDISAIRYRQEILRDCLAHSEVIRQLHDLASGAVEGERKIWGFFFKSPEVILHHSLEVMEHFLGYLRRLRQLADEHAAQFHSEGMRRFCAMVQEELDDAYFVSCVEQLRRLRFRRGVLASAGLGKGNKGVGYVLRRSPEEPRGWRERFFGAREPGLTFEIPERDESGGRALTELRGRGIGLVAEVLGHSSDHILSFFSRLRAETGFYVGCLNLRALLERKGEPTCIPECREADSPVLDARGLYDPCLSLLRQERVVANDVSSDDARLMIITGANQGGKSTFLRSLGLAYLMTQAGMFASAESLTLGICTGLFTHFKREEDSTMESGKLDEELKRLSWIADQIRPGSVLLCNESFASTNEWEGSEIGRQVIGALLQADVRVFLVTHLFNLADSYRRGSETGAGFMRTERLADGTRTFRVVPGEPLSTSYGQDLYQRILGEQDAAAATSAAAW